MRGIARRLRSNFGIGSSRMAIRSQLAWYWRWLLNVLMMAAAGGIAWVLLERAYGLGGQSVEDVQRNAARVAEENAALKRNLDEARSALVERDRQLQVEKAAQGELARTVAQLQDENAGLKDDLGFLRKLMSSGATPEGISVSDLKIQRDGTTNEFAYHMLLTQGGQRKQDFKGHLQLVAHVAMGPVQRSLIFPDPAAAGPGSTAGTLDFRFYQKVEGRFAVPEGGDLKSVEVRVLALPGGQVKLSRTVNIPQEAGAHVR
ncbi:MAG TPA: DUF6776 family protein [Usitatibacter sp.]|nr:DUF6776 family protein [Usitatibacter sp.]